MAASRWRFFNTQRAKFIQKMTPKMTDMRLRWNHLNAFFAGLLILVLIGVEAKSDSSGRLAKSPPLSTSIPFFTSVMHLSLANRSWVEDCWSLLSSSWKSQQARVTRSRHPTNDDANQDVRLGASGRESAATDSLARRRLLPTLPWRICDSVRQLSGVSAVSV